MPIHVPLLFHLNQHLTEYALAASRASYKGLLRVLRAHPTIPVNIHISGTLVHALQWLDPEPLQLIWEGLRAGQFELLGSTYAQNVPYSSDDWDNARQIGLHLKVLHDVFGVTPVTFWNPERTWRQGLLPIIADHGYRFTLIEDHILAKARLAEPVVVTSQVGAHILTLLYDDHLLRHLFNFAVWFGRPRQLQVYLSKRAEHPNVSAHCLTYAEDAGAMGLWGWKNGVAPNQTWHRLDQLLTLMEALPEVELIHLTNAPASAGNLSPIPDGNAIWMDHQLEEQARDESAENFQDWFDYNAHSKTLNQFRVFFGEIRGELQNFEKKLESEKRGSKARAAQQLYEAALYNFLGHQYEFGCVGVGYDGYWGWEGARATRPILRAAEAALGPEPFVAEESVTSSEQDELLLSDGRNLLITSPAGGRLLYWFDVSSGRQYMGNQRAVGLTDYAGDARLPERETIVYPGELPEDFRPQSLIAGARLTAEAAPTRMGKYLPDWIWEDERGPYELLIRDSADSSERRSMPIQRRGFTDFMTVDGSHHALAEEWWETTVSAEEVSYSCSPRTGLNVRKTYRLEGGELHVKYTWTNSTESAVTLACCTLIELTPDYASLLVRGRKAIQYTNNAEQIVVRNTASKEEIQLLVDPAPEVHFNETLLAIEVALKFNLDLAPNTTRDVLIRMRRTTSKSREKLDL